MEKSTYITSPVVRHLLLFIGFSCINKCGINRGWRVSLRALCRSRVRSINVVVQYNSVQETRKDLKRKLRIYLLKKKEEANKIDLVPWMQQSTTTTTTTTTAMYWFVIDVRCFYSPPASPLNEQQQFESYFLFSPGSYSAFVGIYFFPYILGMGSSITSNRIVSKLFIGLERRVDSRAASSSSSTSAGVD